MNVSAAIADSPLRQASRVKETMRAVKGSLGHSSYKMFGAETGMDKRARMGHFRLLEKTPGTFSFSHATQLLAFQQTQTMILGHVQLLGAWFDQDTGVALEP